MPYLYGVSVDKAASDLRKYLTEQNLVFYKNLVSTLLTKLIFLFIEQRYPRIVNTKELFSRLGQFAAYFGLPLIWHLDKWGTVTQGYLEVSTKKLNVMLLEKGSFDQRRSGFNYTVKKSLHWILQKLELWEKVKKLRFFPSTPANRTHSIDALIMYNMLEQLLDENLLCGSIHDCVITTWCQIDRVPRIYQRVLQETLENPIAMVNDIFLSSLQAIIPAEYLPKDVDASDLYFHLSTFFDALVVESYESDSDSEAASESNSKRKRKKKASVNSMLKHIYMSSSNRSLTTLDLRLAQLKHLITYHHDSKALARESYKIYLIKEYSDLQLEHNKVVARIKTVVSCAKDLNNTFRLFFMYNNPNAVHEIWKKPTTGVNPVSMH